MTQHVFSKAHQVNKLSVASKASLENIPDDPSPDFCHVCCDKIGDVLEHSSSAKHGSAVSAAKAYLKHCETRKLNPVNSPREVLYKYLKEIAVDDCQQLRKFIDHLHDDVDGVGVGVGVGVSVSVSSESCVKNSEAKTRKNSGEAFFTFSFKNLT